MSRKIKVAFVFGILSIVFAVGLPAGAVPGGVQDKKQEVGEAQQRLEEIRTEASLSYESYNSALSQLNALDEKIDSTEKELSEKETRLAGARAELEETATQVYKSGNVAFIDVLVGSKDFSEFASRMNLWVKLLAEERDRFEAVRETKNELELQQARLQDQRKDRASTVDDAVNDKQQAANAETEAQAYLESLNGELQNAIQEAEAERAARVQAAAAASIEAAQRTEPATARKAESTEVQTEEPAVAQPTVTQVEQIAPKTSQAELKAQRKAAEQRAARRAQRRKEAEAAAAEAERRAKQAEKEAENREDARQAAAERRAEAKAARQAAREAAVEEAAAERAAERAAQREAARQAAADQAAADQAAADQYADEKAAAEKAAQDQYAADQAAADQAAADQAAADQAAAEKAADEKAADEKAAPVEQTVPEETTSVQEPVEQTTPEPAPEPAPAPEPETVSDPAPSSGESCGDTFGGVQPYVAEVGCAVRAQFGLQTIYGYRAGDPGDHGSGRALDFMVYSDAALGDQVAEYLLANQSDFGISYIIWQQRINFGSGWQPMEDRGSITANHYDHVHASFY